MHLYSLLLSLPLSLSLTLCFSPSLSLPLYPSFSLSLSLLFSLSLSLSLLYLPLLLSPSLRQKGKVISVSQADWVSAREEPTSYRTSCGGTHETLIWVAIWIPRRYGALFFTSKTCFLCEAVKCLVSISLRISRTLPHSYPPSPFSRMKLLLALALVGVALAERLSSPTFDSFMSTHGLVPLNT